MKSQLSIFILRWIINTFGLWVAIALFGTGRNTAEVTAGIGGFLIAGLIFSLVNSLVRPLVVILSLPLILVSLGLFTFVINGFMVYISLLLAPGIQMTLTHSIITGIVLSLINYILNSVFDIRYEKTARET